MEYQNLMFFETTKSESFEVKGITFDEESGKDAYEGFNGIYNFANFDDSGFPVYSHNGDEQYIYVHTDKGTIRLYIQAMANSHNG